MVPHSWLKLSEFWTCKYSCTCHVHIWSWIFMIFYMLVVPVWINNCVKFHDRRTIGLCTVLLQSCEKCANLQCWPTWWRHKVMMMSSEDILTYPKPHPKWLSSRPGVWNCSISYGRGVLTSLNLLLNFLVFLLVSVTRVSIYVSATNPRGGRLWPPRQSQG